MGPKAGHDVRAGMPHHPQRLGVFRGQKAKLDFPLLRKGMIDTDDLAVDLGGQGGLGQSGADFGGDVDGSNATGILSGGLIGQDDFQHVLRAVRH